MKAGYSGEDACAWQGARASAEGVRAIWAPHTTLLARTPRRRAS